MNTHIVSLGCPKNTVDTEASITLLEAAGCAMVDDPGDADLLIVSACSFLDSAWRETVEEIERLAEIKRDDPSKKLVLMGCLPLHRSEDWMADLPFVDHFLPTGGHGLLPALIGAWREGVRTARTPPAVGLDRFMGFENRALVTPGHTAYVKIAEGCSRRCSFCAIPKIRGDLECRSVESIVREVENLIGRGVREVSLLSQDITSYVSAGLRFPDLVDAIARTGIEWIRIYYVHPGSLSLDLARRLFAHPSVCRYLEVPVQHASDALLERMGRHYTRADVETVLADIRGEFPDVLIRSEVIVGFPGETDDNFEELKEFVQNMEFSSLGVFCFSPEPNTGAALLGGTIPDSLKRERMAELTDIQRSVGFGLLGRHRGLVRRVLIDRRVEAATGPYGGCSHAGRYYGQALDIDGEVFLSGAGLKIGEFVDARITDSDEFDLAAEAV